jgi:acetyl-CoA carboxylase carboxyltransferase component
MKAKGQEPTEKEQQEIFDRISSKYEEETSPYYAAARLWTDGIIDPEDTRRIISRSIEAANHAPVEKFNVGVIQT